MGLGGSASRRPFERLWGEGTAGGRPSQWLTVYGGGPSQGGCAVGLEGAVAVVEVVGDYGEGGEDFGDAKGEPDAGLAQSHRKEDECGDEEYQTSEQCEDYGWNDFFHALKISDGSKIEDKRNECHRKDGETGDRDPGGIQIRVKEEMNHGRGSEYEGESHSESANQSRQYGKFFRSHNP